MHHLPIRTDKASALSFHALRGSARFPAHSLLGLLPFFFVDSLSFFFFFQAEDGIRDPLVTGVQTCALPIFVSIDHYVDAIRRQYLQRAGKSRLRKRVRIDADVERPVNALLLAIKANRLRSEERRVGKERRCRWSPNREEKKR